MDKSQGMLDGQFGFIFDAPIIKGNMQIIYLKERDLML